MDYLETKQLRLGLDPQLGVVSSITERQTGRVIEYAGNPDNTRYPLFLENPQWLGDIRFRIFDHGQWKLEETAHSSDLRSVTGDESGLTVSYSGSSKLDGGMRSVNVQSRFFADGGDIVWEATVQNVANQEIELGEVSLALVVNSDYESIFTQICHGEPGENWHGERQRLWHEERLLVHQSLTGHGGYIKLQRPAGDPPMLLLTPDNDSTAFEISYQMDSRIGDQARGVTFEGPYFLCLHGNGAAWDNEAFINPIDRERTWFNQPTSLMLKKDESKTFRLRFSLAFSDREADEKLYQSGKPVLEVQPGMILHMAQEGNLAIKSKKPVTLRRMSGGMRVEKTGQKGNIVFYKLRFTSPGQKKLRLEYGNGCWMNVLFWALRDSEEAIKRHAEFVYGNQWCDVEDEPYHRYHAYMAFDDNVEELYLYGYATWQASGTDEFNAVVAMALAEKNAHYPNSRQIDQLESFVDDFLLKYMQDPETFEIHRGVYWQKHIPSNESTVWDEAAAADTHRAFNYPLHCCIFHSLYKIARLYGLTAKHTWEEYLHMMYRTARLWFTHGVNNENLVGAPAGSIVLDLLKTFQKELPEAYEWLDRTVREIAMINSASVYPYGSELYVDQTPFDQVYAMLEYAGCEDKLKEAFRAVRALRSGNQPAWYLYGNEKRGNACNWYATGFNSRLFYREFTKTGDPQLLKWGENGLLTQMLNIKENGVVRGWFCWWPDRFGFALRTLDSDMGVHAYLKTARSFVCEDETFGLCGYSCKVTVRNKTVEIVPLDGVRKRLSIVPAGIAVDLVKGELDHAVWNKETNEVLLYLRDSTGCVDEAAGEAVTTDGKQFIHAGLNKGNPVSVRI
jgi:hypothetical protein